MVVSHSLSASICISWLVPWQHLQRVYLCRLGHSSLLQVWFQFWSGNLLVPMCHPRKVGAEQVLGRTMSENMGILCIVWNNISTVVWVWLTIVRTSWAHFKCIFCMRLCLRHYYTIKCIYSHCSLQTAELYVHEYKILWYINTVHMCSHTYAQYSQSGKCAKWESTLFVHFCVHCLPSRVCTCIFVAIRVVGV